MDELGNIGDDRSFLSLKVIFCSRVANGVHRWATLRYLFQIILAKVTATISPSLFPKIPKSWPD